MTTLQSVADGVFRASWQATLLSVVILGLQAILGRRISAGVRYGVWGLVLLRLALPVNLPSRVSVHNYYARPVVERVAMVAVSMQIAPVALPLTTTKVEPRVEGLSWGDRLRVAWLVGCGVSVVMVLVGSIRLSRHVRRQRVVADGRVNALLKSCAAEVGVARPPVLVTGPEAGGPALVGFVRPRLLLPEAVLGFDEEALRLIFLHELAHQKRRDVLGNWVLAALQSVHWFNPFVHLVFARVRADREMACDERVLSLSKSAADRPAYGRTIVRLVESLSNNTPRMPAPAVGILEGRHNLRRRIVMIAEQRPVRRAWSMVALAFASMTAVVACTDAVGGEKKAVVTPQPLQAEGPGAAAAATADPTGALVSDDQGRPTSGRLTLNFQSALDARLARRVPELKLESIPLMDALAYLRDSAKVNLFVDLKALEAAGVETDATVTLDLKDITLDQAFRLIGKSAAPTGVELGATADGDVIVFGVNGRVAAAPAPTPAGGLAPSTPGMEGGPFGGGFAAFPAARRSAADRSVAQVYDVDKLVGNSPEKLATLVQVLQGSLTLSKTSSLNGLQPFNGKLVVTATQDIQDQVVYLLDMLKKAAPAAATKEAAGAAPAVDGNPVGGAANGKF